MNCNLRQFAILAVAGLLWPIPSLSMEPNWPNQIVIGTASPGGTYYIYGEGLAEVLTRTLDLPVVALATEGPTQNIELLEAGKAELGFVTIGIAVQAWNSTGAWVGKKPARSMRAIFPMYDTPFQFAVLRESRDPVDRRIGWQASRYWPAWWDLGSVFSGVLPYIEGRCEPCLR